MTWWGRGRMPGCVRPIFANNGDVLNRYSLELNKLCGPIHAGTWIGLFQAHIVSFFSGATHLSSVLTRGRGTQQLIRINLVWRSPSSRHTPRVFVFKYIWLNLILNSRIVFFLAVTRHRHFHKIQVCSRTHWALKRHCLLLIFKCLKNCPN